MQTAVYKITNGLNGKFYIGITANPTKRWWEHRNQTRQTHTKLYNAFKKYGTDAFTFEVMCWCASREDARDLENLVVDVSEATIKGYNMCPGGGGGVAGPDNPLYGKTLPEAVRAKMSAAAKNRAPNPVPLARARESLQQLVQDKNWLSARNSKIGEANRGRSVSEEWRANLRAGWVKRKIKHAPSGCIPVVCVETGEVFPSASAAARHYGLCVDSVCRFLRGKGPKTSRLGLSFKRYIQ